MYWAVPFFLFMLVEIQSFQVHWQFFLNQKKNNNGFWAQDFLTNALQLIPLMAARCDFLIKRLYQIISSREVGMLVDNIQNCMITTLFIIIIIIFTFFFLDYFNIIILKIMFFFLNIILIYF
jgi:hypothetical protein